MNDPHELLEVYDAHGRPTGVAKARGAVHRAGDWHVAFGCWVVRRGERGAEVVLQRRSDTKDVWPGHFDTSASGHVRFGERLAEAAREVEEELGLRVRIEELATLPPYRQEDHHPNGLIDREHHDLHLWRCDLPLEAYRPSKTEVSGLLAVPLAELADLAEGRREIVKTELVTFGPDGGAVRAPFALRQEHLVQRGPGYFRRLAEAAAMLVTARDRYGELEQLTTEDTESTE